MGKETPTFRNQGQMRLRTSIINLGEDQIQQRVNFRYNVESLSARRNKRELLARIGF